MYQIDKTSWGAFVARLRKEKGLTQKELAQRLLVSDKAVSKWETGTSLPDTQLLIPLSEQLGVTVTELLMGKRMEQPAPMAPDQVEDLLQTAVRATGREKLPRAWQEGPRWKWRYAVALPVGAAGMATAIWLSWRADCLPFVLPGCLTMTFLCAFFGAYACFFAPTRLPAWYDAHPMELFCDGPIRMYLMGLKLHNGNWPYVLRALRWWCCGTVALLPLLCAAAVCLPARWREAVPLVLAVMAMAGLFVFLYGAGLRHKNDRPVR